MTIRFRKQEVSYRVEIANTIIYHVVDLIKECILLFWCTDIHSVGTAQISELKTGDSQHLDLKPSLYSPKAKQRCCTTFPYWLPADSFYQLIISQPPPPSTYPPPCSLPPSHQGLSVWRHLKGWRIYLECYFVRDFITMSNTTLPEQILDFE